jgi:hypothetical protein
LFDDLLGDLPLAIERVDGHNRPLETSSSQYESMFIERPNPGEWLDQGRRAAV